MDESITIQDVQKYFGQPIHIAASFLGISMDSLRKICRRNGIKRWPSKKTQIKLLNQDNKRTSSQGEIFDQTIEVRKLQKLPTRLLQNESILKQRENKYCVDTETLIRIFSFLEFGSIQNVALVSKYFYKVNQEELYLMKKVFLLSPYIYQIKDNRYSIEYLQNANQEIAQVESYFK